MDGSTLGKVLLVVGGLIVAAGAYLAFGGRLPFGQLPGDISLSRGNGSFSLPITTCIVLSILLTVILNIVLRR